MIQPPDFFIRSRKTKQRRDHSRIGDTETETPKPNGSDEIDSYGVGWYKKWSALRQQKSNQEQTRQRGNGRGGGTTGAIHAHKTLKNGHQTDLKHDKRKRLSTLIGLVRENQDPFLPIKNKSCKA